MSCELPRVSPIFLVRLYFYFPRDNIPRDNASYRPSYRSIFFCDLQIILSNSDNKGRKFLLCGGIINVKLY
jgi:hypothetical protein